MDDKFCLFENWFKLQKDRWSDIEITVTNTSYEKAAKTYYHNYKIELSSENSEGTIQLFENNDIYWVDLECVNFDKDEYFCISVDYFESIDDISVHVQKLETIMI
ncbi:MAG: hypothetical protein K2I80_06455 [Ruminococcus sp.]|nr:hypothetical protein [Ruminococcus sp.]MDE6848035.1 hypothetical protein [Ruminococcus sp.]